MNIVIFNIYIIAALCVGLFIIFLLTRTHRSAIIRKTIYVFLLCLIWILLSYFEILFTNISAKILASNIKFIGITFLPFAWLRFCLESQNNMQEVSLHPIYKFAWIPCCVTAILVWFDQEVGFVRQNFYILEVNGLLLLDYSYRPWFWIHVAYSYLLILIGSIRLVYFFNKRRFKTYQFFIIISSILLPAAFNILFILRILSNIPDPTPILLSLTAAVLVYNNNILKQVHITRQVQEFIIDEMRNPIIVLSDDLYLLYANDYACNILNIEKSMYSKDFTELGTIISSIDFTSFSGLYPGDIFDESTKKYYSLYSKTTAINIIEKGIAIILYDITEQKLVERSLMEKNTELSDTVAQKSQDLVHANKELNQELERRLKIEAQLLHDAIHDPLTKIGNRSLLNDVLKRVSADYQRNADHAYCILYIDFDGFKEINDSQGHYVGDMFLIEVSKRLSGAIRESDVICRVGGDEFVAVLTNIKDYEVTTQTIQRIYSEVTQPLNIGSNTFYPSLSIGVSCINSDIDYETLIKNADIAMYYAKSNGKNQWAMFDESMHDQMFKKSQIISELNRIREEKSLYPVYQPVFDRVGKIVSWETLLRWKINKNNRSIIKVRDLIEVAEETHNIIELGNTVIRKTLELIAQLKVPNDDSLYFSLNISPDQLLHPQFKDFLLDQLEEFKLSRNVIRLEISELNYSKNIEKISEVIRNFQKEGIEFILDNFGLLHLDISKSDIGSVIFDVIKIDKAVTQLIVSNKKNSFFMEGIILLAKNFGRKILIEGVENKAQAEKLWSLGIDLCQGWHLGKDLKGSELVEQYNIIRNS